VFAPEEIGMRPGICDRVLAELDRRGVRVRRTEEPCPGDDAAAGAETV
jgi:hypothetical protein